MKELSEKKIKQTYKEKIQNQILEIVDKYYTPELLVTATDEHQFMRSRKWRFDWVIPELMIAIDYDGYVFSPNKKVPHVTPGGMANDMEKRNEAQIRGWIVIVCTQKTIDDRTFTDQLERAIKVRKGDIRYEQ
jgi:hypothetical protein